MHEPLALHIRRNSETRDSWERFAPHRERVNSLLMQAADDATATAEASTPSQVSRFRDRGDSPQPAETRLRLCVLGAGNCNDLDLAQLLAVFAEIHLVDLDGDALAWGLKQQQVSDQHDADLQQPGSDGARIVLHGGVDLTGLAARLSSDAESDAPPTAAAIAASLLDLPELGIPGTFDVVVSLTVLTQILDTVRHFVGDDDPQQAEAILAARTQHVRLLTELVRAGGIGLLVTDFVSSNTLPELGATSDGALPQLLRQAIAAQNFFTGCNPFVLENLFESGPELSAYVGDVRLLRPWIWDLGPRLYAVCTVRFQRTAAGLP